MTITWVNGMGYAILSTSGKTYRVTEQSHRYNYEYDAEYMSVWGCNCPAGQHNKMCKHVAAVLTHIKEIEPLVDNFFEDYETCYQDVQHLEEALSGWLWFSCPANRRIEVEEAIKHDARFSPQVR